MDVQHVTNTCIAIIHNFSNKQSLQEFELLTYEQACRTLETVLKDFREVWETQNELGDFKR